MNSLKEKWSYIVTHSMAEIFQPSWELPHKAILEIERELEKTIGREKALELIGNVSERLIKEQVAEMLKEMPINSFEDFLKLFQSIGVKGMWDKLNVDEYVRVGDNVREAKTVQCIYADIWRKWSAPEVGYQWHCAIDFPMVKAMHPNLRLERTKTLMQGDDCCDFKFIWEEKD